MLVFLSFLFIRSGRATCTLEQNTTTERKNAAQPKNLSLKRASVIIETIRQRHDQIVSRNCKFIFEKLAVLKGDFQFPAVAELGGQLSMLLIILQKTVWMTF